MPRSAMIHARVEPSLKRQAEKIFQALGLTASDVMNALYAQVALRKGLPFPLEIPNEETRRTMADISSGKGVRSFASSKEFFRALKSR